MNREIDINKFNKSITFQNRGIGFSQMGVADEILNLIDDLQQENKQLKEDKKKAIDYIKNYDVFKEFTFPLMKRDEENQVKSSIDYQFKNDLKKNLLEILGDKENEI